MCVIFCKTVFQNSLGQYSKKFFKSQYVFCWIGLVINSRIGFELISLMFVWEVSKYKFKLMYSD